MEYAKKNFPGHQALVCLLSPSKNKITQKEYWAARRGQEKLKKRNDVSVISTLIVTGISQTGHWEHITAKITSWNCLNKTRIVWRRHRTFQKQNICQNLLPIRKKRNTAFLNTIPIMIILPIRLPSCLSSPIYGWIINSASTFPFCCTLKLDKIKLSNIY